MVYSNGVRKAVAVFTGVPGVGKSTIIDGLEGKLIASGLSVARLDDYWDLMQEWMVRDESEGLWEPVEGSFNLFPQAYPVMSPYVARRLGEKARVLIEQEASQVVLFEAARGAGHDPVFRDDYRNGLFGPLLEELPSEVALVNFEVLPPDIETLMDRARFREQTVPGAPPAFVTEKYLEGGMGAPYNSATAELAGMGMDSRVLINRRVENGAIEMIEELTRGLSVEMEGVLRQGVGEGSRLRRKEG